MDVIGVGMGRTGTNSLKLALEELGFGPCYHMKEVQDHAERPAAWIRILDGATPDWDEVYRGYGSTMDWPGTAFWRELVDAFPKAKVVLSERDPQRWVDSMAKTLFRWPLRRRNGFQRAMYRFLCVMTPGAARVPLMLDRVLTRTFGDVHFSRPGDRDVAIKAFLKHNEDVKAYVPADRLLVFQVSEGWEPLCAFLGVPVPETPFPRVNDTKEFQDDIAARTRRVAIQTVVEMTLIMAAIVGAVALTGVL
ncbi:MAG TPA: sulfotransferase [Actinocrinis sp.]|uniref:sulfotransferase family protein n=1 Tax=Actinocrinis sp. TaxID=1920516 RepID=UPI002DDCF72D|nr:sulfotransferase [Actinocrinis sp.]HEV2346261.1 sulfotransferase [Actinocrinis sp.]